MRIRNISLIAAGLLITAACGLPSDGEPRVIASDRVPDALDAPPQTGTTILAVPDDEIATVYVFTEEGNTLRQIEIAADDGPEAALVALLDRPELTESQTNFLPPNLELEEYQLLDNGFVLLDLSTGLEEIESASQAKAIAQLVYTIWAAEPEATGLAIRVDGNDLQLPDESGEQTEVVWLTDYSTFTQAADN